LNKRYRAFEIVMVMIIAAPFASQGNAQSTELSLYMSTQQVNGVIRIWGSPQMGDLLKRYEEGFRKVQPSVHFEDALKSTVSAVAGVYSERADIGLLGREIWPSEAQAFESVKGHAPTTIEVATGAYDVPKATYALMIFVHRSNPIKASPLISLIASSDMPPGESRRIRGVTWDARGRGPNERYIFTASAQRMIRR
jgi:phosphate transport system substrate-binding protein